MTSHLRPDTVQVVHDHPLHAHRIDRVESAVGELEQRRLAHAQLVRRRVKLRLTRRANHFRRRPLDPLEEAAALATRSGEDVGLHAFPGIFGERPARPERFIVGVGEDAHQAKRHRLITA